MFKKTTPALVLFAILLSTAPHCAAQSGATPARAAGEDDPAREADELKRRSLVADLRALESESKELRAPLDVASAKAEIAAALWTLERERAKRHLSEALPLTFPEEVDRAKTREHTIGARLQMGPLEEKTRPSSRWPRPPRCRRTTSMRRAS
jgi:hypothetical protein